MPLVILAATGTNALWFATANDERLNGYLMDKRYCYAGRGETSDDALGQANNHNGPEIGHGLLCDDLSSTHSKETAGYWYENGSLNYMDSNWHWYCNPGLGSQVACDAGGGAPRKRARDFAA
ncbi:hypothetical protein ACHAP5_011266 [Fusarium lateritium]